MRTAYFKRLCIPLTTFVLILAANVAAHSGHTHDDDPAISLPGVLAKVNGTDIGGNYILRQLKQAIGRHKAEGHTLTADQEKTEVKKLLEDEISRVLLAQRGKELGIQVASELLEERLKAVRSGFQSDKQFEEILGQEKMTVDQYKDELRTDLLIQAVVKQEIEPNAKVEPGDARDFYEKNKNMFYTDDQTRASVILIKIDASQGADGEKAARAKIQSILDQTRKGADFAELARQNSQDSLKARGGDLGFFTKNRMLADFSEKAFAMKEGDISDVFQTRHGLHILKVTGKKPGGYTPFEEAEGKIKALAKNAKITAQTKAYADALKKNADIKIYF